LPGNRFGRYAIASLTPQYPQTRGFMEAKVGTVRNWRPLLDGHTVRKHLSRELGFSGERRASTCAHRPCRERDR
jgi:hypothetical protein